MIQPRRLHVLRKLYRDLLSAPVAMVGQTAAGERPALLQRLFERVEDKDRARRAKASTLTGS